MKRKFNRSKLISKINQDLEKANLPLIVDIYVERQGDFTVASVLGTVREDEGVKGYNGLGISKRSVRDKFTSYGAKLAVSRAVSNMIQKYRKVTTPPEKKTVIFTAENISETSAVATRLRAHGVEIEKVLSNIGNIIGKVDARQSLGDLRQISGVLDVTPDMKVYAL